MIFQSMILAAIAATTVSANSFIPSFDVPASSRLGSSLLAKATPENEGARKLEQQDRDNSWLYNYKIKYLSCSSLIQIGGEGQGGGGNNGQGSLYIQNLVKFGVCKASDTCSSCSVDATYVVNMVDFIDAYTEYKLTEQEYMCEMVRENCYCDNANDDEVCENQCYVDAGLSECVNYEGEEEFEIQRYLECAELENNNNNNNNNNNGNYNYNNNNNNNNVNLYAQYFTGPYCSEKDGKSIHLGVFMDEGCTVKAGSGVYEAFNYGQSLPFSTESLVKSDCISCMQVDNDNNNNNNNNGNNNNNNNNNNNYEVIELCERSIEDAAKCESNVDLGQYYYPDTSACNYINNILPKLEKATRSIASGSGSGAAVASSEGAATALAVIFSISTLILGAYSFFLYRKIHRAKVNLSRADGVSA